MATVHFKKYIPPRLIYWLKKARNVVLSLVYRGKERYCPVCGKSSRKFVKHDIVENSRCVHCGAHERHRVVWLYLSRKTDLFNGVPKKMLTVGIDLPFDKPLKSRLGANYLTADLFNLRAMIKMDVSDIHYPEASFDVVYCSHVLTYVPNDRQGMRELFRVLKPHGWAILADPIRYAKTTDVPFIDQAASSLKMFNTEAERYHHYGPDYEERLRAAGFKTQAIRPADFLNAEEMEYMGITIMAHDIFYCIKE
ncbi:MAG: type 11 methyltransferase [Candidatus Brocadiaceae bacterium]|nr:type 11 methyltransferase [Candidatus Brocadiaceae bacterium]